MVRPLSLSSMTCFVCARTCLRTLRLVEYEQEVWKYGIFYGHSFILLLMYHNSKNSPACGWCRGISFTCDVHLCTVNIPQSLTNTNSTLPFLRYFLMKYWWNQRYGSETAWKNDTLNVIKTKIVKSPFSNFPYFIFPNLFAVFQFNLQVRTYRTYGTLRHICNQLTSNNICMISQQLFQTVNDH